VFVGIVISRIYTLPACGGFLTAEVTAKICAKLCAAVQQWIQKFIRFIICCW